MFGHTIVSRAFAPIDKTLFLLCGVISRKTKIFFLKGRSANKEVKNAKVFWKNNQKIFNNDLIIRFESYNSLSSKDSSIIKCTFREKING